MRAPTNLFRKSLSPHCGHGIVPGILEKRKLNNLQFQLSGSMQTMKAKELHAKYL